MRDLEPQVERLERFDRVDATGEQAMFIAFLDRAEALPDVVRRRRRSRELLAPASGARVADVGCGLGTAVRELAHAVGASGRALGIDLSRAMIDEAERRARAAGVSAEFHVAPAERLPVADGALAGYRAERLYQHLPDPAAALAEAHRVLAPGGRIVLVDQDWDAVLLDSDDLATARDVRRAFADSLVNGTVGSQYRRRLLDAGFREVTIEVDAVATDDAGQYGFVVDLFERAARAAGLDARRLDAWRADQDARIAAGRFFLLMPHFVASATR
jgi:ubiquinone/menaquinone biosynthesis C-methylase UbiE